jgi:hypothetical protein
MVDYTLCTNKNCPLRTKCYRGSFVSTSNWQSYSYFEMKDGECKHFVKLKRK